MKAIISVDGPFADIELIDSNTGELVYVVDAAEFAKGMSLTAIWGFMLLLGMTPNNATMIKAIKETK